jgi:hypothetical protein
LRITQYYALFKEHGFDVVNDIKYTSEELRRVIERNFPLHRDFAGLSVESLATTAFRAVLRKQPGKQPALCGMSAIPA